MPQMMRPQMDPVTRLAARNARPTSVTATASASYLKLRGDQEHHAADQRHEGAHHGGDRHRHVEEDDLEDGPLVGLRREPRNHIDIPREQQHHRRPESIENIVGDTRFRFPHHRLFMQGGAGLLACPPLDHAPILRLRHKPRRDRIELNIANDLIQLVLDPAPNDRTIHSARKPGPVRPRISLAFRAEKFLMDLVILGRLGLGVDQNVHVVRHDDPGAQFDTTCSCSSPYFSASTTTCAIRGSSSHRGPGGCLSPVPGPWRRKLLPRCRFAISSARSPRKGAM